jgi:hypothetical protein
VPTQPSFPPLARARADLTPGALYSIGGGDGHLYYGQVCRNKQLGFFRFRSTDVFTDGVPASSLMSRFSVALPSIGRALRSGHWLAIGRFTLSAELNLEPILVQWPVGTTRVTLWQGPRQLGETDAADPNIQELEVIAAYDANAHVPSRLNADFLDLPDAWKEGGSVRRHRLMKEDFSRRFPDQPWHRLPSNWVATSDG